MDLNSDSVKMRRISICGSDSDFSREIRPGDVYIFQAVDFDPELNFCVTYTYTVK